MKVLITNYFGVSPFNFCAYLAFEKTWSISGILVVSWFVFLCCFPPPRKQLALGENKGHFFYAVGPVIYLHPPQIVWRCVCVCVGKFHLGLVIACNMQSGAYCIHQ